MEETNLQEDTASAQPLKPEKKLSKTPAKVMTAEESRLYFQEQRERKLQKDQVKAERQKKFETNLHAFYQSYPSKFCSYVSYLLINILPIGAIIVGILYIKKEDCPADHIAIAMILVGIFGVITSASHLYAAWKEKKEKKQEGTNQAGESSNNAGESETQAAPKPKLTAQLKKREICVSVLFKITETILWIYACVIVFRLYSDVQYEKTDNASDEFYCHKILYRYAYSDAYLKRCIATGRGKNRYSMVHTKSQCRYNKKVLDRQQ